MSERLKRDAKHEVLVIIPTIAIPSVLLPAFARLLKHLNGVSTHIVVVMNPKSPADGEESWRGCMQLWLSMGRENITLTLYNHGQLAGFGGAINLGLHICLDSLPGLAHITSRAHSSSQPGSGIFFNGTTGEAPTVARGIPALTVIYNDDLMATDGWLPGLQEALTSEVVYEWAELAKQDPETLVWTRPVRRMVDYGDVGLVGPASNCAAGIQQIDSESIGTMKEMGWDKFSAHWREKTPCTVVTASFLSGFCMGITYQCMEAIAEYSPTFADSDSAAFLWLFDEAYTVAGYEDNDLVVRADQAGFRAIVAASTMMPHIGHQSFDATFPDWGRGMRNRLVYYDKWRNHGPLQPKVVAAFRVRFDVPHDLALFRLALRRAGTLVDGVSILLTRNPAAMLDLQETKDGIRDGEVPESDQHLLRLCAQAPAAADDYLKRWAAHVLAGAPDSRFGGGRVRSDQLCVQQWTGEFNEREERNHLLSMAEGLGADWVFSIDHDELVEPRITRPLLERLMRHPDPMVQEWDLSFVNHWIDTRMYRVDRPWGDGGTWTGGMRGFRFYRVNKAAPRRILAGGHNGLHCGNVPGADGLAKRVAGVRMRHLGYVRWEDRFRKERRYNEQDPNPDPLLVGGTSYAHITADEGMELSPFVQVNGIGLHMLLYEGENADDLGRLLDGLYGVMDEIVLVWTGEWTADDQEWLMSSDSGGPVEGNPWHHYEKIDRDELYWPETGPGWAMARMAAHFGARWIHHPLADDLGAARNAGIEALARNPSLGWALFFDPDEQIPQQAPVHLRRMAEAAGAWGWMLRFKNVYQDGGGNQSESVRMSRLDPDGRMRLYGRVHEGFSRAVRGLVDDGFGQVLRVAPFFTINTGLAAPSMQMQEKLERYRKLTEMQLEDDPTDPSAWVTLGLYWANEGCLMTAETCLSRAVLAADKEYLPYQELALHLMRKARHFMAEAVERMEGHAMAAPNSRIVEFLDKAAPPMKLMGFPAEHGFRFDDQEAMLTLPQLPEDDE